MSDEVPQPVPGEQTAGHRSGISRVSLDKGAAPRPASVHDQQTVAALPAAPADAGPAPWTSPAAAGPFAPPAASAPQPNPFAPPPSSAAPQPNPFAPPPSAYAPQGATEPVPPPPIAPGGPGQVPYGYPGTVPAQGYPSQSAAPYGVGPYPAGGYGWTGAQAVPSNGMGTASLVLGILSAVGFLFWPLALVLGILAIIFGAIGRGKAKRGEATNPGVALAGLICGVAGIVMAVAFVAVIVAVSI
ncbi:DUF4190 domain-containing protein [Streptomyces sp. NPDC015171]|uniref:DUF4190 domain-containing protein n=1 Tax=Streptomyces sp. NPDC015171 TaxID=3364945 RepID=UPI0036F5C6E8